jgi:error-prone DNA polymerase
MSTVSLLEKYGWHEWLCHSNFSFLLGASHPHELYEQAQSYSYQGIGLCDFDGLYGIVRMYRAKKKRKHPHGPKIYYGVEFHLEQDHQKHTSHQHTIVLYPRTLKGYQSLCHLVDIAHQGGKHHAYLPIHYLRAADRDDLVAILPMRGIMRSLSKNPTPADFITTAKELFADRLYLAISHHMHLGEDFHARIVRHFSEAFKIPVLMSQDVFMHHRSRKPMSDVLHAIRNSKTLDQCGGYFFANGERSLHTISELSKIFGRFRNFESALRDSHLLAQSFDFNLHELKYRYPQHLIPSGCTSSGFLEQLVWDAAYQRYGDPLPQHIKSLLEKELKLVAYLSFENYFLTVWDIVNWAKSKGIMCQGRGSAANSAICFVLGITAVDPQQFDLLFERFISAERGDPPDIDVDFEHQRREEVIQYIYKRFGRQQAAMVANIITFRTKGALRSVGEAFNISNEIISRAQSLAKDLRTKEQRFEQLTQELIKHKVAPPHLIYKWVYLSESLRGFPRHLGIHSGGFIISDQPLNQLCGQEPATMPGRSVIQWSKEDIEYLGFFKIDILALGILTAIRQCLELINQNSPNLHLANIPQDDPQTYEMIQRADTMGTFQIESRAQMAMLPRLRPQNLYDLVVEVGIVRPGPIQGGFIHPYLKRRQGLEPITYPHPSLRPILERTMGIPIFQEQVMRMAMAVGDFTPGEADELRRKMGAWQIKGDLQPIIKKLELGMTNKGIHEKFITQVIQQIKGFAEYGFPESHAASFASLAYISCYLKCHYHPHFLVALLNSQPMGFYSPHALIQDARRHGIEVRPITVNHSDYVTTLEPLTAQPDSREPSKYAVRLGLHLINSLAQKSACRLVEARKKYGMWENLQHFFAYSQMSRSDLTYLAAAEALQCFAINRKEAIWSAAASPYQSPIDSPSEIHHPFEPDDPLQKIQHDFASTQTSLGEHPCSVIVNNYWNYPLSIKQISNAKQLEQKAHRSMVYVFGMVISRQAPPSANGMVFLTLEDSMGLINLAINPKTYQKHQHIIDQSNLICALGQLQKNSGSLSISLIKPIEPELQSSKIIDFTHPSPSPLASEESFSQNHAVLKSLSQSRDFY